MTATAATPAPTLRQLLREPGSRDFRALWLARLASQGADGVFEASLVGFTLFSPQDAPDARAIAGSLAAVLLPFSLVGPFAGIALDRVRRQRILAVSAVTRAALMIAVAALMAGGQRGAPLIVLAVVVLAVARFTGSALSASLPLTVPRPALVTADSATVTTGGIASLIGVGLGAGVRALAGSSDSRQPRWPWPRASPTSGRRSPRPACPRTGSVHLPAPGAGCARRPARSCATSPRGPRTCGRAVPPAWRWPRCRSPGSATA